MIDRESDKEIDYYSIISQENYMRNIVVEDSIEHDVNVSIRNKESVKYWNPHG